MYDVTKRQLNISLILKATIVFALMVVAFSVLSYASIYFCYLRNFFSQIGNFQMELSAFNTTSLFSKSSYLEYALYSFAQNVSVISQIVALDIKFVVCYYMDMLTRVKSAFVVSFQLVTNTLGRLYTICKKAFALSSIEETVAVFSEPNTRLTI